MKVILMLCLLGNFLFAGCSGEKHPGKTQKIQEGNSAMIQNSDTAMFAAGCFWCVEAVFQRVKGVISVSSGYAGGSVPNPSYEQVCSGSTGHAEACRIVFDSTQISFIELLEIFWGMHDPTTLNKQGADEGTQYRSAIFYYNEQQKDLAEAYKEKLDKSGVFSKPVVTEITQFTNFYPAEDYHQDYYNGHKNQPYCSFVITPKLEKFKKVFNQKLKPGEK